jgi:riboflavin kinase/FMN adenylyltransferase
LGDELGCGVCVLTFDPPAAAVLERDQPPGRILPAAVKHRLLGECGADAVVVARTTPALLDTAPEEFIRQVVVGRFAARGVVEGPDFSFGRGRAGSIRTLRQFATEGGFQVVEVPRATVDLPGRGRVGVSSSLIRRLLRAGDVEAAGRCLTRPFALYGHVVAGERRGRVLAFPTANVEPDRMIVPGDGVYAARSRVAGAEYPAAVSIGDRPTFGPGRRAVEVHLIGTHADLYGQAIEVAFLARLRDQEKFPDAASLSRQIAQDVERVREICR